MGENNKSKNLTQSTPETTKNTWDNSEGYYCFTPGEIIKSRYEVLATHGRGVFSTVLRVRDLNQTLWVGSYAETAIKIIRRNEAMSKAAHLERTILNKLALTDPEDKHHIIRLIGHFEYRNHTCLVLEPMDMNLRSCVKKFGKNLGLNLIAVQTYTIQLLKALKHLKNNRIIHADIKPDNILISKSRMKIKICDFGSAMFSGPNELTPYLVSRFYRAPEVILGLPYDSPIDIWSIGCVINELYSGNVLFPGNSNNEMIQMFIHNKGLFPKRMIHKGTYSHHHFNLRDANLPFISLENKVHESKTPNKNLKLKISKNKKSWLLPKTNLYDQKIKNSPTQSNKLLDLLEKMITIDPEKRLTPAEGLAHPFCNADHFLFEDYDNDEKVSTLSN
eukprot:gnl/TRDRNA2_/TRDRNA2_176681_c0_seq2.p1 gnl/TRDRNA2_/TRDRNA2_176681_c0~~gnl/TRDRNA2_/TRDRNA2_176681_c0_seq2.p1  ORF type:complete len:390 (+),score=-21.24 gnl/TRDRNA2_/TRDRNA2_176681_c0_seq2:48-1217(+)